MGYRGRDGGRRTLVGLGIAGLVLSAGVGVAGCGDGDDGRAGRKRSAPVIVIAPVARQVGDVTVEYVLIDADDDDVSIAVEYSTNGGAFFTPATAGAGGDGTTGLAASAGGTAHSYEWNSVADFGGGAHADLLLRFTPSDARRTGLPATTDPFVAGNDAPKVSSIGATGSSGLIPIFFTLSDTTSDVCSVTSEFSTDLGLTFAAATITVGNTTNLATDPVGVLHSFAWNSFFDLGTSSSQVIFRITPFDDLDVGAADDSPTFTVSNNDLPLAFIRPVPRQDGDVIVDFFLLDPQSDLIDVTVEFSTDSGTSYLAAALDPVSQVTGLSSSPAGDNHSVVWQSLGAVGTSAVSVRLRITPTDPQGPGTPGVTPDIIVGNDPPSVQVSPLVGTQTGLVRLDLAVCDSSSDPVDLDVEFTPDGGISWFPAISLLGRTVDVPSSPACEVAWVEWNTIADLGMVTGTYEVRITPSDRPAGVVEVGAPDTTGPFTVDNVECTAVYIAPVHRQGGDVTIDYLLFHPNSMPVSVWGGYSTDGGATFALMTITGGSGTSSLPTSPTGEPHVIVWDSATDLGPGWWPVHLVIQPSARCPGLPVEGPVDVGNDPPSIAVTPIGVAQTDLVPIDFTLTDSTGDPVDVVVEYSTDAGITFGAATIRTGGTENLASDPGGTAHLIEWDTGFDLGIGNFTVEVRLTPCDEPLGSVDCGPPGTTGAFAVNN